MGAVSSQKTKTGGVLGKPRCWQWPTILAFDAPTVTAAWQWLFAKVCGAELGAHHFVLLWASVWMAYAADRWIDGWALSLSQVRTQRHFFFLRWRWPFFAVWCLVLVASVALAAATLTAREWGASLSMMAVAVVYLLVCQALRRIRPEYVPKEVFVAAILAAGACLYPAMSAREPLGLLAGPASLFLALCLANCLLIAKWEREVDLGHGHLSFALQFSKTASIIGGLLGVIMVCGLWLAAERAGAGRQAGVCGAAGALLLFAVDLSEPRIGRELARLLADVALFTPLVLLLLP